MDTYQIYEEIRLWVLEVNLLLQFYLRTKTIVFLQYFVVSVYENDKLLKMYQ